MKIPSEYNVIYEHLASSNGPFYQECVSYIVNEKLYFTANFIFVLKCKANPLVSLQSLLLHHNKTAYVP